MSTSFRKLREQEIWQGAVVSVASGQFEAPDGERITREIVHHPGAVVVVPVDEGDEVILVHQFRAPLGTNLLELPAGKRDVAGEPPEITARRELAEEIGMEANEVSFLANFYNSPGFCDEYSHLFLATGLSPVGRDAQGAEERHMTIERVPLSETSALIAGGRIQDAKTIIGLLLARDRLSESGRDDRAG